VFTLAFFAIVLASARRGLIFTRSQKGTQPGGLTHLAKQSRVFHTMCRHAGFGLGGAGQREGATARECAAAGGESGSVRSALLCCVFSLSVSLLLLFPLFAVLLNCPYPDPPGFFLPVSFHSPLHPSGGRGDRVALLLPAAAKL